MILIHQMPPSPQFRSTAGNGSTADKNNVNFSTTGSDGGTSSGDDLLPAPPALVVSNPTASNNVMLVDPSSQVQQDLSANALVQQYALVALYQQQQQQSSLLPPPVVVPPPPRPPPSTYRDYSGVKPPEQSEESLLETSLREPTFPVKLYNILSNPEYQDIVSWLPHGRSWRVKKPVAFEEKVIPLFFNHKKYSSFKRQVNGWGFQRVTEGVDHNSYYHEMFLRGMPHLCRMMRRSSTVIKRNRLVHVMQPENPDFYRISEVAPLPGDCQEQQQQQDSDSKLPAAQVVAPEESQETRLSQPTTSPTVVAPLCDNVTTQEPAGFISNNEALELLVTAPSPAPQLLGPEQSQREANNNVTDNSMPTNLTAEETALYKFWDN